MKNCCKMWMIAGFLVLLVSALRNAYLGWAVAFEAAEGYPIEGIEKLGLQVLFASIVGVGGVFMVAAGMLMTSREVSSNKPSEATSQ